MIILFDYFINSFKLLLYLQHHFFTDYHKLFTSHYEQSTKTLDFICIQPSFLGCTDEVIVRNENKAMNINDLSLTTNDAIAYAQSLRDIFNNNHLSRSIKDEFNVIPIVGINSIDYIKDGILIFRGTDSSLGGHEWIADGGSRIGYELHQFVAGGLIGDNVPYVEIVTDYLQILLHFNWGMNGAGNGFFNPDVFSPSQGAEYDYSGSLSSANFNGDVKFYAIQK